MRKSPETVLTTARKPRKLPDYFTIEEASALVAAAPGYQVRMVMRIMLRTGGPPAQPGTAILSLRADAPGIKPKRGRECRCP